MTKPARTASTTSSPAADRLADHHLDRGAAVLDGALRYLRPELLHPERIPSGGALVVGNHALLGIDSFALYPPIWQHTRRLPRGLGDRFLFKHKPFARLFGAVGAVEGRQDVAVQLLEQGELCLVYPGGSAESFKGPDQRYQLFWQGRSGFARVAMRAQVPIVPIMAAGVDHAYRFLFRDRLVMRNLVGHGKDRYDFPVSLGLGLLPLPVRFTYHVGEPIPPPVGAELADDPQAVAEFAQQVWQIAQAQLDEAVRQWQAQPRPWMEELALRVAG